MNEDSNSPGGGFSSRINLKAPIKFRRESQPSILKDEFSSKTDLSIFTSIAPVFLDRSNETS